MQEQKDVRRFQSRSTRDIIDSADKFGEESRAAYGRFRCRREAWVLHQAGTHASLPGGMVWPG